MKKCALSADRESFSPLFVLGISIFIALMFAGLVMLRYEGEREFFLLYYFVPIGIPFVAYLLDRTERSREIHPLVWLIDLLVVGFSLARAFYPVPIISGHALFLTYAILTTRSWPARMTAALVMLEVLYLKIFAWHDPTLIGGIGFGFLAAGLVYLLSRKTENNHTNSVMQN